MSGADATVGGGETKRGNNVGGKRGSMLVSTERGGEDGGRAETRLTDGCGDLPSPALIKRQSEEGRSLLVRALSHDGDTEE